MLARLGDQWSDMSTFSWRIRQLRSKFKHGEDFGIEGNFNKENLERFRQALQRHIRSSSTERIVGTYRGQPLTYYYNPNTRLNVMFKQDGTVISRGSSGLIRPESSSHTAHLGDLHMRPTEYKSLIEDFLEGKISAQEFERSYLSKFKNEPGGMDHALYEILQELFSAVDSYSPNATSKDKDPFTTSEETLKEEARSSLRRLKRYLAARE